MLWSRKRTLIETIILSTYNIGFGLVTQNEQFLLLQQSVQLFSVIIPTIIEIFHIFEKAFSKKSVADLLYVGKG